MMVLLSTPSRISKMAKPYQSQTFIAPLNSILKELLYIVSMNMFSIITPRIFNLEKRLAPRKKVNGPKLSIYIS